MGLDSVQFEGFTVESNHETGEQVKENFNSKPVDQSEARVIKPIPPEKELTKQTLDGSGRTHDETGKFAGGESQDAKVEAASDEKPAEPETKPAEPEPKRSKAKERIRGLVEEKKELERLLAAERRDRERLFQERTQSRQEPTQSEPENDPYEPQREAYADDKSYTKALAKYEAQKLFYEARREEQAQAYAHSVIQATDTFRTTVEKAGGDKFLASLPESIRNLKPTYSLADGEKPGPLNFLANEILHGGERGISMMKYLADNPSVFRAFSSPLQPRDYERLMGKIEAALDAATAGASASEPSKPKAPAFEPKGSPPIRPVSGGPHNVDSDDDLDELIASGKISFEDAAKRMNKRDRAKRHA